MASEVERRMQIEDLKGQLSDEEALRFEMIMKDKRRDPTTMILLAAIGFFGVAGMHRFVLGQVGMGILYLLTAGLCFIGTIVDMVRMKTMVTDINLDSEYDELRLFLASKAARERRAREAD